MTVRQYTDFTIIVVVHCRGTSTTTPWSQSSSVGVDASSASIPITVGPHRTIKRATIHMESALSAPGIGRPAVLLGCHARHAPQLICRPYKNKGVVLSYKHLLILLHGSFIEFRMLQDSPKLIRYVCMDCRGENVVRIFTFAWRR